MLRVIFILRYPVGVDSNQLVVCFAVNLVVLYYSFSIWAAKYFAQDLTSSYGLSYMDGGYSIVSFSNHTSSLSSQAIDSLSLCQQQ